MIDSAVPDPTVHDQITDSITQMIKYKDGHGNGKVKKITVKFLDPMTYDDAISKYSDKKELHVPSIEECNILHELMRYAVKNVNYLTTELRDENTITVADIIRRIYIGGSRKEKHNLILVFIEYES